MPASPAFSPPPGAAIPHQYSIAAHSHSPSFDATLHENVTATVTATAAVTKLLYMETGAEWTKRPMKIALLTISDRVLT